MVGKQWDDLGGTSTSLSRDRVKYFAGGAGPTVQRVEMRMRVKAGTRCFGVANTYSELVMWPGTRYTCTAATTEYTDNGEAVTVLWVDAENDG